MEALERNLRRLLARRPAPPGFTARVMASLESETPPAKPGGWAMAGGWRWPMVGALAASLALGVYFQQRRVEVSPGEAEQAAAAERAAGQLLISLQIAGTEINKAREAVLQLGGESP